MTWSTSHVLTPCSWQDKVQPLNSQRWDRYLRQTVMPVRGMRAHRQPWNPDSVKTSSILSYLHLLSQAEHFYFMKLQAPAVKGQLRSPWKWKQIGKLWPGVLFIELHQYKKPSTFLMPAKRNSPVHYSALTFQLMNSYWRLLMLWLFKYLSVIAKIMGVMLFVPRGGQQRLASLHKERGINNTAVERPLI